MDDIHHTLLCDIIELLLDIIEHTAQKPSIESLKAKLYDANDDLLGEHFSPLVLLEALTSDMTMIDLFLEDEGSVPVDIRGLTRIEVYRD